MITRRAFLASLVAAGFAAPAYARFVEPRWLGLSRRDVRLPGKSLKSRLNVLHLSDFHASSVVPMSFIREAIELGLAEQPDLICVTGDFVTGRSQDLKVYRDVLVRLARAAPTFACLGNHDGGPWVAPRGGFGDTVEVRRLLNDSGIACLENEHSRVSVKGQNLWVVGLGDLWANAFHPERAFTSTGNDEEVPTIVLSHNPDSKELLKPFRWDLLLCGHTHGGQISLPLLGTPFAPVQDHGYVQGLHEWDGRWIHITRGVGNLHGVRFNCRPEVSMLAVT